MTGTIGAALPKPDDIQKQLESQSVSPAERQAAFAQALDAMIPELGDADIARQANAHDLLQKLVFRAGRPGADAEREALSKAMCAKLKPGVPVPARVWILRELARCGRAESAGPVAAQLSDPDALVRETARRTLAANPSAEAAQALRAAIGGAKDPVWRAGLIDALAYRRDPADAAVFRKEIASSAIEVRLAAAVALSRTGTESDAAAIRAVAGQGAPDRQTAVADALTTLADRAGASDPKAAAEIFRSLLTGSTPMKCAGLWGLGRTAGPSAAKDLLAALDDPEPSVVAAALAALEEIKSPEVTKSVAEKSRTMPVSKRAAAIASLGRRCDPVGLPAVVAAAGLKEPSADAALTVRLAALAALARIGDASVVPMLLQTAATTGGAEQAAARETLELMRGETVETTLKAAMTKGDAALRLEAIRALVGRAAASAVPGLVGLMQDPDKSLRAEAIKALRAIGDEAHLGAVIDRMVSTTDAGDRSQLILAVAEICRRVSDPEKSTAPLLAALKTAGPQAKPLLVASIGRQGGPKALAAVSGLLSDSDEVIAKAAFKALSEWPDRAAMPDLLAIAKGERSGMTEVQQILALGGYIRLIGEKEEGGKADVLSECKKALGLAKRPDEIRQVLSQLGKSRNGRAFDFMLPLLDKPEVAQEACLAAVELAKSLKGRLSNSGPQVLSKVAQIATDKRVRRQAEEFAGAAEVPPAKDKAERKAEKANKGGR